MKNPLKKLSGAKRNDRRETLEQEAAEKIKQVGSQPPPEVSSATWAHPAPEDTVGETAPAAVGGRSSAGRRLTVQERMAARS